MLILEISTFLLNVKMSALKFFWNACLGAMTTIATEIVIEMIIFVSTVSNISIEQIPESISKSF